MKKSTSINKGSHEYELNSNDITVIEVKNKSFKWDQCKFTSEIGNIVSVLGRDEGYTVKYTPSAEGFPEGEARGNS